MENLLMVQDQPAARLTKQGPRALNNVELVSVLIGGIKNATTTKEQAQHLIEQAGTFANLRKWNKAEIVRVGLTEAQAMRLIACAEITRRTASEQAGERAKISGSNDVYQQFRNLADLTHEEFHVLYLNRANRVMGSQRISQGGISGTVIDVRLVLKAALERSASSIILAHNHPSGNLKPSESDIKITKKIGEASKTMEVQLLDHLIISDDSYFSFSDEGMI